MGIARNIARLIPNGSGLLPNANIEAMAASKLTGQVPDANAPSGSVITSSAYAFTSRVSLSHSSYTTYLSGTFTKSRSDSRLMIIVQISGRTDANGAASSRVNLGSSTVYGGSKYTTTTHTDVVTQIFDISNNTETGSLSWNYQQNFNTFSVLNPTSGDDNRIENCTSRVLILEVMP